MVWQLISFHHGITFHCLGIPSCLFIHLLQVILVASGFWQLNSLMFIIHSSKLKARTSPAIKKTLSLGWICFFPNWGFQTVVLEKTLENPLDSKEIKPVNPKGNQSSICIGRTDAEAEAPILWPPDAKSWLIRKDPEAGKEWRQEEEEMTEDKMVGWHYQLNGHEFEQTLGESEGQGRVVCCSSWGHQELDTT